MVMNIFEDPSFNNSEAIKIYLDYKILRIRFELKLWYVLNLIFVSQQNNY